MFPFPSFPNVEQEFHGNLSDKRKQWSDLLIYRFFRTLSRVPSDRLDPMRIFEKADKMRSDGVDNLKRLVRSSPLHRKHTASTSSLQGSILGAMIVCTIFSALNIRLTRISGSGQE